MAVADAIKNVSDKYKAANAQSSSMGSELSEKAKSVKEFNDNYDAKPSPLSTPSPKAPTAKVDKVSPGAKYGDKGSEKRLDTDAMRKPLGSFKKGTKRVPKTGPYIVHKDEAVLNKKDADQLRSRGKSVLAGNSKPAKGSGKKPHKMQIEALDDDTFQMTHQHKPDESGSQPKDEKFSARNPKQLTRHIRQVFGGPEDGSPENEQ